MSETRINIEAAKSRVEQAERELSEAKLAHELAFKEAVVILCNEYGLYLEAPNYDGLNVAEIQGRPYTVKDLDNGR